MKHVIIRLFLVNLLLFGYSSFFIPKGQAAFQFLLPNANLEIPLVANVFTSSFQETTFNGPGCSMTISDTFAGAGKITFSQNSGDGSVTFGNMTSVIVIGNYADEKAMGGNYETDILVDVSGATNGQHNINITVDCGAGPSGNFPAPFITVGGANTAPVLSLQVLSIPVPRNGGDFAGLVPTSNASVVVADTENDDVTISVTTPNPQLTLTGFPGVVTGGNGLLSFTVSGAVGSTGSQFATITGHDGTANSNALMIPVIISANTAPVLSCPTTVSAPADSTVPLQITMTATDENFEILQFRVSASTSVTAATPSMLTAMAHLGGGNQEGTFSFTTPQVFTGGSLTIEVNDGDGGVVNCPINVILPTGGGTNRFKRTIERPQDIIIDDDDNDIIDDDDEGDDEKKDAPDEKRDDLNDDEPLDYCIPPYIMSSERKKASDKSMDSWFGGKGPQRGPRSPYGFSRPPSSVPAGVGSPSDADDDF